MAPKSSDDVPAKRSQYSLRQATLSFKAKKRGATAPSKVQGKKKKSKPKVTEPQSQDENEGEVVMINGSSSENEAVPENLEVLDMQDKAGKYRNYYRQAKESMGWIPPIHSEGQSKIHHMLRVFDNTYEYGPCVGMTRLERWERAQALGLNPPIEVHDILMTEQGRKDVELVQPVFYGQVL